FGAASPAAVQEALDATGLGTVGDRHPYDLGYARRKLVTIAAVLAMETPVVVLDEPTTRQDRAGGERLVGLLAHLRDEVSTMVVVSLNRDFVRRTIDRAVQVSGGLIVTPE